ncbi:MULTISPECIES: ASCH domain-containing protein [unclassified Moraxella]|uniref:ASCH domain-containing protein n=1 Tax=unclassified Moraxella TaxID=2685852 RepID=UPI00359D733C
MVISGTKTATCTALQWHLDNPVCPVGSLQVITDGDGLPRCVIQNTAQFIIRFCDVDEKLAQKEGEGDLSLAYWQDTHQQFFEQFEVFDDKMWLLFEIFKVIKIL